MAIFQHSLSAAAAAAATVFAALTLPAWAQPPATPTPTSSTAVEPAAQAKVHDPQRHEQLAQRMAQQAQKLEAALQLSEGQLAGWTSYRAALQLTPRAKRLDHESFAKLTTPERLDHMRQLRAERNAQADRRAEATKAFYATLTPAQQKTFDAQTLRHGKHHAAHHQHGKQHAAQPGSAVPAAADQGK